MATPDLGDTLVAGAPPEVVARAAAIRLVLFDVDGTLTDGRLFLGDGGAEFKVFDAKDGQGVVMLRAAGLEVGIITGRASPVVTERMAALGVRHIHQAQSRKRESLAQLKAELGMSDAEVAYVGDDLPDIGVLRQVGLALCPSDAHPRVQRVVHWVLPTPGGRGAGRATAELILAARGQLESVQQAFEDH